MCSPPAGVAAPAPSAGGASTSHLQQVGLSPLNHALPAPPTPFCTCRPCPPAPCWGKRRQLLTTRLLLGLAGGPPPPTSCTGPPHQHTPSPAAAPDGAGEGESRKGGPHRGLPNHALRSRFVVTEDVTTARPRPSPRHTTPLRRHSDRLLSKPPPDSAPQDSGARRGGVHPTHSRSALRVPRLKTSALAFAQKPAVRLAPYRNEPPPGSLSLFFCAAAAWAETADSALAPGSTAGFTTGTARQETRRR